MFSLMAVSLAGGLSVWLGDCMFSWMAVSLVG